MKRFLTLSRVIIIFVIFAVLSVTTPTNSTAQTGNIIFYGASNFAYWSTMEDDLSPFRVQNHSIGGSTDTDLLNLAESLLYPFKPYAVILQNGTNDYLSDETTQEIMHLKDQVYTAYRKKLPDCYFIVISGLPLPGRTQYWDRVRAVNTALRAYCSNHPKMLYVDATPVLTSAVGDFKPEYFYTDGVHLNADGYKALSSIIIKALHEIGAPTL